MSDAVLTGITGSIGTITLNKPWKLNAWDTPMRAEITAQLNEWNRDPAVKAVIMKAVGTDTKALTDYFNKMKKFAGVYGDISFSPDNHDGYPDAQVVMVEANSLKEGAFNLAPGYGAS